MKRLFTLLTFIFSSILALAQTPKEVDFTVHLDSDLRGVMYPSLAMYNAHQDDPTDLLISFTLNATKLGSVVRVTVEDSRLNRTSVTQLTVDSLGLMLVQPIIKWNYEVLMHLDQPGVESLSAILEIDGREIDRKNIILPYRSINECVFGMIDSDTDEYMSINPMYAMYVNEDNPRIDGLLRQILSVNRNRKFFDYQGTKEDVLKQMFWVWEHFSKKGTRYSDITTTSNASDNLGVQYVRFFDQVVDNVQANCVDGSVMLASIYRKIGLNAYLVMVPGHCFLAVGLPYDQDGNKVDEDQDYIFLETTLMGSVADPRRSFDNAVLSGAMTAQETKEKDLMLVDIKAARAEKIPPIGR